MLRCQPRRQTAGVGGEHTSAGAIDRRVAVERGGELCDPIGAGLDVVIDEGDDVIGVEVLQRCDPGVAGVGEPLARLVDHSDGRRKLGAHLWRFVRRVVVDDDDLWRWTGVLLPRHARERAAQGRGAIMRWDYDPQPAHAQSPAASRAAYRSSRGPTCPARRRARSARRTSRSCRPRCVHGSSRRSSRRPGCSPRPGMENSMTPGPGRQRQLAPANRGTLLAVQRSAVARVVENLDHRVARLDEAPGSGRVRSTGHRCWSSGAPCLPDRGR